ncbi:hypothetical protein AMIS_19840 [Actinoplanes missouriensis 431]|uniref:Uncharacterized protein n=1 Tax=Actinoplanes missouriensis (strain ATCC 14538 / DSM 43046 / CBS 188.64 / JCM 3121 / NBRC 102363 / NCIMB 12654 / NRRL B-3342 / UNCC 431) TaxID=512565 RepID=I0H2G7_ACTM4|nr:hypothetical protein [Actinoplanes missouriensis]BAL87204.1 hypothetical protein AMIS_19840 [Actinoplanes missouriensis 431]
MIVLSEQHHEPQIALDALARVLQALRDQGIRSYLPYLDHWRTQGGTGGWAMDWQNGAYADEIAMRLLGLSLYDDRGEHDEYLFGKVTAAGAFSQTRADLFVCGVHFSLRALDPIGYDATHERIWGTAGRLAAAFATH